MKYASNQTLGRGVKRWICVLLVMSDLRSGSSFEEDKAGRDRIMKIQMVCVRFSLFALHQTEQLPS